MQWEDFGDDWVDDDCCDLSIDEAEKNRNNQVMCDCGKHWLVTELGWENI